jgi:DNA repair photolyase
MSKKFNIGAHSFKQRLEADCKVQKAGYPLRVRLDPIVPFDGWQGAYSKANDLGRFINEVGFGQGGRKGRRRMEVLPAQPARKEICRLNLYQGMFCVVC